MIGNVQVVMSQAILGKTILMKSSPTTKQQALMSLLESDVQ